MIGENFVNRQHQMQKSTIVILCQNNVIQFFMRHTCTVETDVYKTKENGKIKIINKGP